MRGKAKNASFWADINGGGRESFVVKPMSVREKVLCSIESTFLLVHSSERKLDRMRAGETATFETTAQGMKGGGLIKLRSGMQRGGAVRPLRMTKGQSAPASKRTRILRR